LPVLLFKLSYATFEVAKLSFPPVPGVLCGDTVTMGTSFLSLLWSDFRAGTLTWWAIWRGRRRK